MFGLNFSLGTILLAGPRAPRVAAPTLEPRLDSATVTAKAPIEAPVTTPPSAKLSSAPAPSSASPGALLGSGQRFAFVDALRGLAALGVAAYHIFRYGPLAAAAQPVLPGVVKGALHHGWIGVQIFFVISGFVIAYALRDALMTPGYFRSFALQRFFRLGPPYWCTIALVLGLHLLATAFMANSNPLIDELPSWPQLASHSFYLQNVLGFNNISVGFWTLCIEMQFYLLFALLLGLAQRLTVLLGGEQGRSSSLALTILFLPLALVSLFWLSIDGGRTDSWAVHFFIYFFLGALVFWTIDGRMPKALLWGLVAAILVREQLHWTLDLCVGLSAGVAIYVCGRTGNLGNWLNFAWLQRLGLISYSLYLIHYPVSWIISSVGYELTGTSPVGAVFWLLLGLAASIGIAQVMHNAIELPAIRLSHRFKPSRGPRPAAGATQPTEPRLRTMGGQVSPGLAS
jgi:peptidoglycan/LPS O-acetylase OafA/YrhL